MIGRRINRQQILIRTHGIIIIIIFFFCELHNVNRKQRAGYSLGSG